MPQSKNLILASLAPNVFAALERRSKCTSLRFGDLVAETGEKIRNVYFPLSGVISLVVDMTVGGMIETAMVGRDGVANATSALDGNVSLYRGIVQLPGEATTVAPNVLGELAREFRPLQSILIRHEQVLLAQAQQSAACNASHTVEARMCRWLLRMRDLSGSDDLMLTQEFLAQMLGVQRPSVSVVAGTLQSAGIIQYRRGKLRILDLGQLTQGACECHATVNSHYARLSAFRRGQRPLAAKVRRGRSRTGTS
jgi:CRP-like cAMP-binding protein